jgi:hypothetical protein
MSTRFLIRIAGASELQTSMANSIQDLKTELASLRIMILRVHRKRLY